MHRCVESPAKPLCMERSVSNTKPSCWSSVTGSEQIKKKKEKKKNPHTANKTTLAIQRLPSRCERRASLRPLCAMRSSKQGAVVGERFNLTVTELLPRSPNCVAGMETASVEARSYVTNWYKHADNR